MSPLAPRLSGRELIKRLSQHGFLVARIRGSYHYLEPVPKMMILRSENSSAGWARATAAEEHSNSENLIHLVL